VDPDTIHQLIAQRRRQGLGVPEQVQAPAPRDHAERNLETARPVDAHPDGVGVQPVPHLAGEDIAEPLVAVGAVGLRQTDEPLMAVQFPDDPGIPNHGGIQGADAAPVQHGRATSRHGVEVPVDRLAEGKTRVAEQGELARHAKRQKLLAKITNYGINGKLLQWKFF
jgi:hypothetical protein